MNESIILAPPPPVPPQKSWPRRLSLLVATLVCVTLVGSLSLVLALRTSTTSTGTTGRPKPASAQAITPRPTATPTLAIPAVCKDKSDQADEVLCAKHEETFLNITKSFTVNGYNPNGSVNGPGTVNITFQRAYADPARLMLVYTINHAPGTDWGGFVVLSTRQGDLGSNSDCLLKGFCVQSFDTSTLPAGITQLQVQTLRIASGASIPLSFTLPFHAASKTIGVKQTVTGQGYTLTLDHLVLTGSVIAFTFAFKNPNHGSYPDLTKVQTITINSQQQIIAPGFSEEFGVRNSGVGGHIELYQSLLDQSGTWTVTLALVKVAPASSGHVTWTTLLAGTFTFTVPA